MTGVSMSLKNKVAIATAGNSGIGKAIPLEFAKNIWGWRVLHSGLDGDVEEDS
jgi:NAD(P)-dependent dehydrogenase (short-subunit alcohol dehydrogenase family)